MDANAKITVLKRSNLFGGLPPETLEAGAEAAKERKLDKGDALFQQGDDATTHYIVASGRLRLDQATPDGKNVVLRFMGPGDLVGSVAVMRGIPYPATPIAVDETRVLSWTQARMMDLMQAHPALAMKAINMMGGRIEELQERLQQVATQQVERRIAATVLKIVGQSGRKTEAGVEIPFPLSRQDLAEMTGTTLHTVSRTLSAWIEEGIIEGRRSSHIVIKRPHRLVEISEQA
ncbi:Crp/Fnr family transcriptional regulator [Marinicauda sp. Alg238-R41]|uniref:Crp/Fnr family transcriptional regulator n=1 Tax=Marinicauda sp. Alg238-R41 TaxID=2993447 RepID=UPI0022DEC27E|nr:Crp/Fnr family transcriptional regulator [Marinicauda sp. Alg238-R41]